MNAQWEWLLPLRCSFPTASTSTRTAPFPAVREVKASESSRDPNPKSTQSSHQASSAGVRKRARVLNTINASVPCLMSALLPMSSPVGNPYILAQAPMG
jgi:hypothetical protein